MEELQNGRYKLLRLIGQGAMGKVYLAEDTRIGRQVAIKVIQSEAGLHLDDKETEYAVRLFHREAQIIARFNHPHILPLFDFDEASSDGSSPMYMVMPYCPDGSFADWLRRRKDQSKDQNLLAPQDIVQLVNQAADALQHAHEHGIIHCDVKPANFLLRDNRDNPNCPDLLLADFGVARLGVITTRTSQSIRGTPTYMSPEQWRGTPVPAADQYALAVMTYELLTGHAPFQGNPSHMMYQHLTVQPPSPSTFNSHLSAAVDAVLLHALAKEPAERFPSVSDFARALQSALLPEHAQSSYETYTSPPTLSQPPVYSYPTSHIPDTVSTYKPVPTLKIDHQGKAFGTLRRRLSGRKVVLLVGLALLVILTGVGSSFLLLHQHNAVNTNGTPGATQTPNPYPPNSGTLVLTDPLRDNSQGYDWNDSELNGGMASCGFVNNTYLVVQDAIFAGGITSCNPEKLAFQSDFTVQVQVTIVSGDAGGISFRAMHSDFYLFAITPDGSYHFEIIQTKQVDGLPLPVPTIVRHGTSPAIHQGLNQSNLLAVVAIGNRFSLYVNKHLVDTVTDSTFQSGKIGLAAEENNTNTTKVIFSDAMVWKM